MGSDETWVDDDLAPDYDDGSRDESLDQRHASLDAERNVLGAMLLSSDAVWTAQSILRPEDFADPRHEVLARVIVRLTAAGGVADRITVAEALERDNLVRQAGGISYLFELDTFTAANVEWHAEIVHDRAVRRTIALAGRAIFDAAERPGSAHDLAERARAILDDATTRGARRVARIGDDIPTFLDSLERGTERYRTPWDSLDRTIGGFRPGRLYVIAARPGAGKTIMGVQIADRLCQYGGVAYASLEMERRELLARLFASRGDVPLTAIDGTMSDYAWKQLATHRSALASLPLFVDDSTETFVSDVQAHARTVKRNGPLVGIVVDYLGLLAVPKGDRRSRWEQFTEISHDLKRMAKALHVPVIALQQLGRDTEKDGKQRPPVLSDIRDSGAIEQDADVVMLLHRQKEEANTPPTLHVNVAKNRHGPTLGFHLGWRGATARLTQIEQPDLIPSEAT